MRSGEAGVRPRPWLLLVPALVSLLVGLRLGQPSIFPDESGAILNARAVVGVGEQSPWWYLPGYGALLAPVALVAESPAGWVRGLQIVNAVLLIVGGFGLLATLRLLSPESAEANRRVASVLALVTPSSIYFASFALADNALVAQSAWLAPSTAWLKSARRRIAASVGFAGAVLAATVHSRSIIFPLAVAFALLWGRPTVDRAVRAGTVAVGAVVGRVLSAQLLDGSGGSVLSGTGRQSVVSLIGDNLSVEAVATLPGTILGQIFAVTIASMGMAVVGIVVLLDRRPRLIRDPPVLAMMIALTASVVTSVLFTNGGTGDFALYARYVEVALAPVLAVGWLAVWERTIVPHWGTALAVLVAGPLLVLLRGAEAFEGRVQRLNVAGLAPFIRLGDGLDPLWLALLGATALAVVAVVARWSIVWATVSVLVVFTAAVVDNVQASRDFIEVAGGRPELASGIEEDGCLSLDQSDLEDFWFQEHLRLHRLDVSMPFWSGDDSPPCGDAVLSSRVDVAASLPGWVPVAVEPGRVQWLWFPPDRLDGSSSGLPVGASLGAPLVEPSGRIDLAVRDTSEEETIVELTVENTSTRAFVPTANLPAGMGGVQVGLEWRSPGAPAERMMEPMRVALPALLLPGDRVTMTATVGRSSDPGANLLHAELVQEGVGWIETISDARIVEAER